MKLDKHVEKVLRDLAPYLKKEYAFTGSISYKLLIPEFDDWSCRDIDIVVYPVPVTESSVENNIRDKFYIIRLFKTKRGIHFSLIHKNTGIWVDIFPRKKEPAFTEINLADGRKIKLVPIEESVYGLCLGILERIYLKKFVGAISFEKLKCLAPHVNLVLLNQLIQENLDQTVYLTPFFAESINTTSIIQYIIKGCKPYIPPGYKLDNYPSDQITTPNGLRVEDPATYKKAMGCHFKYLEDYKKIHGTRENF